MGYIFSGLTSLAVAMLAFILQSVIKENKKLKKEKKENQEQTDDAIRDGVTCLLRIKLIEYHDRYMNEQSISSHGYENWKLMYKAYKALGGNGMIEHMKDEIEELRLR